MTSFWTASSRERTRMKKLEELGASPAPWEQDDESALPEVICHLQSGIRYQVAVPYIHSDEETDANTRLICAAPALFECLREAIVRDCINHDGDCLHCMNNTTCQIVKWRNAIARASGEGEV